MESVKTCPICESENTRFLFEGWDYLYGYPRSGKVRVCRDCRHVFVEGTMTEAEITEMYTNYYPRSSFYLDNYQANCEKKGFFYWLDGESGFAFRHVPPKVRVLDVGCGYCETLGYYKSRGCEVWGVESDENVRKIAEKYGFQVNIGLFSAEMYEKEFFDYVTLDMVLEHALEPEKMLRGIREILKSPRQNGNDGGRVVVSVPNPYALGRYCFGKYWGSWHLPFHRHFYSRKSMRILAEKSGFVVEKMHTRTQSDQLLNLWSCFLFARKKCEVSGISTMSVSQGRLLSNEEKRRWDVWLYSMLKKYRVFSPFMRLADGLGVGDWNLIVLRKI